MYVLRFASTCIITATLLTLGIILINPTLDLVRGHSGAALGPGVLPAICLVGVLTLSVYVFFSELAVFLRSRKIPEDPARVVEQYGLPLRAFVGRSAAVLTLLWAYVVLWQMLSFIPATLTFTIGMGICIMPPEARTAKGMTALATILGIASVTIWFIFVQLLGVHLR